MVRTGAGTYRVEFTQSLGEYGVSLECSNGGDPFFINAGGGLGGASTSALEIVTHNAAGAFADPIIIYVTIHV